MKFKVLSILNCVLLSWIALGGVIGPQCILAEEVANSNGSSLTGLNSKADISCDDSLVHIATNLGCANGFCLKQKNGTSVIVTCYRGIAGAPSAKVLLAKDTSFSVDSCLAYDAGKDLLILPVPDDQPLKGLQLASEDRENRFVTSYTTLSGGRGALLRNLHFEKEAGKVETISSDELWAQINSILEVDDECKRLGLSPDARWLSSNILIRKENRGNPLIDFTGRVVGVNSWSRITDKLTKHQAIPPSEIQPLLNEPASKIPLADLEAFPIIHAGSKYVKSIEWLNVSRSWASRSRKIVSLPNQQGQTALSTPSKSTECQCVKFYSEKKVTLDSLHTWDSRLKTFDKYEDLFFGKGLNLAGKIEGMAGGTLEKAENLRFLGTYKNGLENGTFFVWQKGTIPVIQCEYTRGKREKCYYLQSIQRQGKEALACLFIVEFNNGIPKRIYHFSDDGNELLASYDSLDEMKANPDAYKQWESMETIEKNLKVAKYKLRKEAKKVVDATKRAKSAVLGKANRKARAQRRRERQEASDRYIQQLKKAAGW